MIMYIYMYLNNIYNYYIIQQYLFYLIMNSDKIFEPDLELAEAFYNLFFEIIMPSLIIMGYFLTTKKVKLGLKANQPN